MSSIRLDWQLLLPEFHYYSALFERSETLGLTSFIDLQPRLAATLHSFCQAQHPAKLLILKGKQDRRYLSLLRDAITNYLPQDAARYVGSCYEIQDNYVTCRPATKINDNFATTPCAIFEDWADQNSLFGFLCRYSEKYQLQPGLVHKANGGILIIPLQIIIEQPWLWLRLKQILLSKRFDWYAADESKPLPFPIPSMTLDLKVIFLGDDDNLIDFSYLELHSSLISIYTEIEPEIQIINLKRDGARWVSYVNWILQTKNLPSLCEKAWYVFLRAAIRHTENQQRLPICPLWIESLIAEAAVISKGHVITEEHLEYVIQHRCWRENYLPELLLQDMQHGQLRIETEGSTIGQLNGLSVAYYPGHTTSFGEPSRISCVVHLGDGDFTDVESKTDLGGNIHAKGMMIMQAYLVSELALEQPIPFSASLVFEQSYCEVDGDSASLAGLCALASALAKYPLSQQIAVTGAVDQFGRVLAVGGINQKIEGFFALCEKRGLTGEQGVILPATNVQHICLTEKIIEAVQNHRFHIWTVDHVADALPLLTGIPYKHEKNRSLLGIIRERIDQVSVSQDKHRKPFFLRWLN